MLCPLSYRRSRSKLIIPDNDDNEQRSTSNLQSYTDKALEQRFPLKEAIEGYLLSCKVEGKSLATIEAYKSKLYPFLWYCQHYNLPDDVTAITTQHIREFLAYLRDNQVRFGGHSTLSRKPVNRTTIQRYYRVLCSLWTWLLAEELTTDNPLLRIRTPRPERKVIKALSPDEVKKLLASFDNSFDGKRNKAILFTLIDGGLRLGELLRLRLDDVDMQHQLLQIKGKTGERVVRFGTTTAKALLRYLMIRGRINGSTESLWLTSKGQVLTVSGVQSMFKRLSTRAGIEVHPHLLRHTFATMWLLNGGDSLMLQRLLGHTTLTMTNRYCQAVGSLNAIESHKKYSPVDNLRFK